MSLSTDGQSAGLLTGVAIDSAGTVMARYSNGMTRPIDALLLEDFVNEQGLDPAGDGLLRATAASGAARTGTPGQDDFGHIVSGALEMSTVDLAREMVALIISQRSFQVNSRVISVVDKMYGEAADLKR